MANVKLCDDLFRILRGALRIPLLLALTIVKKFSDIGVQTWRFHC
jgi:hypothetical protein